MVVSMKAPFDWLCVLLKHRTPVVFAFQPKQVKFIHCDDNIEKKFKILPPLPQVHSRRVDSI